MLPLPLNSERIRSIDVTSPKYDTRDQKHKEDYPFQGLVSRNGSWFPIWLQKKEKVYVDPTGIFTGRLSQVTLRDCELLIECTTEELIEIPYENEFFVPNLNLYKCKFHQIEIGKHKKVLV